MHDAVALPPRSVTMTYTSSTSPSTYVPPSSGPSSIRVASETECARWVHGRSKTSIKPIEALEVEGRPASVFVADQLIIDSRDKDLLAELVDRYGATIIPRPPLLAPPEGLGPRQGVNLEAMPLPALVHVTKAPAPSSRAAELLRAAHGPTASVTSQSSARLVGLAAELVASGKHVGLNTFAKQSNLSLANPVERNPADPLTTAAFTGKARVAAAWQLVETFRQFRSTKSVTIGVLDSGFWLNGFKPFVPAGQVASDLGSTVMQVNLLDESVGAGGASAIDGFAKPWHGNGSASVAAAKVGNALGAAGVGGSVAQPVLFKTDGSLDYFFRCLHYCLAWGVDVLNMSLTHDVENGAGEFFFPTTAWDSNFQFASDNGLIMVASAGNDQTRIPEDSYVRPATRTPGTITVGALDGANNAQSYSNYGSSVDIWAPTDIPVIPNDNFPSGTTHGGTSAAAPFVSGILAMMRAVAPIGTLDPGKAKQLLMQSGWRGSDKVGIGVDAYAAVLAAMGGRLPDEAADAHATADTARQLTMAPDGTLGPFLLRSDPHLAALASTTHQNWYAFTVSAFSKLDIRVNSYPLMGAVSPILVPDDPDSRALSELTQNSSPGFAQLVGLVAAGTYKLSISGALNLYELSVAVTPAALPADEFERNDTFETAAPFLLLEAGARSPEFSLVNFAGRYNLTLQTPADRDFFRIDPRVTNPLSQPVVRIDLSDARVSVTLFDSSHNILDRRVDVRDAKLTLPRTGISFVEVSGSHATRYRLTLRLEVDQSHLPGGLQGQETIPLPDLGDPPFQIDHGINHLLFHVDTARATTGILSLASDAGQPIRADVLDGNGHVVRTASSRRGTLNEFVDISVNALEPGAYVLRIQDAGTKSLAGAPPLNVQVVPSFQTS
jgi:hypothetical protein